MVCNAPEFWANVCEAVYDEDPMGFDMRRIMCLCVSAVIERELLRLMSEA